MHRISASGMLLLLLLDMLLLLGALLEETGNAALFQNIREYVLPRVYDYLFWGELVIGGCLCLLALAVQKEMLQRGKAGGVWLIALVGASFAALIAGECLPLPTLGAYAPIFLKAVYLWLTARPALTVLTAQIDC